MCGDLEVLLYVSKMYHHLLHQELKFYPVKFCQYFGQFD